MQGLVKLIMNSLHGVQIRKDINKSYHCKPQHWIETEFDKKKFWIIGNYLMKNML